MTIEQALFMQKCLKIKEEYHKGGKMSAEITAKHDLQTPIGDLVTITRREKDKSQSIVFRGLDEVKRVIGYLKKAEDSIKKDLEKKTEDQNDMFLVAKVSFKKEEYLRFDAFLVNKFKDAEKQRSWFEQDEEAVLIGFYKMKDGHKKEMIYEQQNVPYKADLKNIDWDFWWKKIREF